MDTGELWTAQSNNFEINNNQARVKGILSGDVSIATLTSPFGVDVSIEIKFTQQNSNRRKIGIVGRWTDSSNYWRVESSGTGNGFRIYEINAGTETLRTFANPTIALNTEYTMRATFSGNTITATIGATTIQYASATHNNTATTFGIYGAFDPPSNVPDIINDFLMWRGTSTPPANPLYPFSLTSPSAYQIYQRNGSNQANISITGTFVASTTHDIEARFNGGTWVTIATAANGSGFSGTLSNQAVGQGALEVRFVDDISKNYSLAYVGIGDVFVIAGQSNAVGVTSAALQTYSHATLKAGLFGNDYHWRELVDPTDSAVGQVDSVSDDTGMAANGSYWPLLATSIMASTGLPVAFVPTAKSATAILPWLPGSDHQDRTTLYGSMVYRSLQVGGVKAILWHQGESDATINNFTGATTYNSRLDTLANAIATDLNVKLISAKIHKWDSAPSTSQENVDEINGAIVEAEGDNINVLAGPNFDSPTRVTSGLHFNTASELQDAADRWWAAINSLAIL